MGGGIGTVGMLNDSVVVRNRHANCKGTRHVITDCTVLPVPQSMDKNAFLLLFLFCFQSLRARVHGGFPKRSLLSLLLVLLFLLEGSTRVPLC